MVAVARRTTHAGQACGAWASSIDHWFETLRSQTPTKWPIVFDSAAPECEWRNGEGFVGGCVTLTSTMTPGGGYSTSEIGNATCGWLNHLSASAASSGVRQPWLAFVAVESPKFGPAPWHWQGGQSIASSPCTAVTAPRLPSYNFTGPKLRAGVCTNSPSRRQRILSPHRPRT